MAYNLADYEERFIHFFREKLDGMDLVLEINVVLWGYIVPFTGVFRWVRFKEGGPYGEGGTYISNMRALAYLLGTIFFSHFILNPMIRGFVEFVCSSNRLIGYLLIMVGLGVMWFLIKRKRTV